MNYKPSMGYMMLCGWVCVMLLMVVIIPGLAVQAEPLPPQTPTASPGVREYLRQGSQYYLMHDYANAIGPYKKALELEKRQPTLDKNTWRVLVDNLGMAYGISGDLKNAIATLEYGISKDKTYPMFYYNLACAYAEMNDLDKTIANLKTAYRYRQNMIEGEDFPDPAQDDSFQRFMHDERFLEALRQMQQECR